MNFTDKQKLLLSAPLSMNNVLTREKAGMKLFYVESWHCIDEANKIFGFDGWCRETIYCKEISRNPHGQNQKVGYEAKVRITVGNIIKEGTGHGSQVSKDLFDAIEGAAKEAESDAMKRALMMFGNAFGLALYDKERKNVEENKPVKVVKQITAKNTLDFHIPTPKPDDGDMKWGEYTSRINKMINDTNNFNDFDLVRKVNKDGLAWLKDNIPDLRQKITDVSSKKQVELKNPKPPAPPLDAYNDIFDDNSKQYNPI